MSSGGGSLGGAIIGGAAGPTGSLIGGALGGGTGPGGIGSMMGSITGTSQIADAEGAAANAQLAQQQSDRSQAMGLMAPTQAEMQQLQQSMALNQQSIGQAQQLIGSADPALISAAQQAQSLMNGGSAASLAPIQNQRANQKSQLQAQLQQQLGPGYATSSAGIQALNNFDQQTANLMTNAQQSAIGMYLGTTQNAANMGNQQQQQGFNNQMAGNQMQYGWQTGQASALQGTPVNPGLAYSGQLANAQNNSFFGLGGLMPMIGAGSTAYKNFSGGSGGAGAGGGAAVAAS